MMIKNVNWDSIASFQPEALNCYYKFPASEANLTNEWTGLVDIYYVAFSKQTWEEEKIFRPRQSGHI